MEEEKIVKQLKHLINVMKYLFVALIMITLIQLLIVITNKNVPLIWYITKSIESVCYGGMMIFILDTVTKATITTKEE